MFSRVSITLEPWHFLSIRQREGGNYSHIYHIWKGKRSERFLRHDVMLLAGVLLYILPSMPGALSKGPARSESNHIR